MGKAKWCTKCGARNKIEASYCTKCGHPFEMKVSNQDASKAESGRKSSIFDSSDESMHARGYAIAVILGSFLLVGAQSVLGNQSAVYLASSSIDAYQAAIGQAQLFAVFGLAVLIGGIIGLIKYVIERKGQ